MKKNIIEFFLIVFILTYSYSFEYSISAIKQNTITMEEIKNDITLDNTVTIGKNGFEFSVGIPILISLSNSNSNHIDINYLKCGIGYGTQNDSINHFISFNSIIPISQKELFMIGGKYSLSFISDPFILKPGFSIDFNDIFSELSISEKLYITPQFDVYFVANNNTTIHFSFQETFHEHLSSLNMTCGLEYWMTKTNVITPFMVLISNSFGTGVYYGLTYKLVMRNIK